MRHARQEAEDRIGRPARVLEPSPPAVTEPPFFADDPVDGEGVSPIPTRDPSWDGLARQDSELTAWAAERWLGAWKRLEPLPAQFVETRLALHRIAEDVMKPAREAASGKFGLRWTLGGFGTPFFGEDVQLRVEGAELVRQERDGETGVPIPGVDETASRALGDLFGFGASVLEELRAESHTPARVQLWPEHFDIAFDAGDEAAGQRANYGISPGDAEHPEPYLYVGPWSGGYDALPYADLLEAPDQRAAALAFFRGRRDRLAAE